VVIEVLLEIVKPVKGPHAFREFFERTRESLFFVFAHVSFERVGARKVLSADFAPQRSCFFRDFRIGMLFLEMRGRFFQIVEKKRTSFVRTRELFLLWMSSCQMVSEIDVFLKNLVAVVDRTLKQLDEAFDQIRNFKRVLFLRSLQNRRQLRHAMMPEGHFFVAGQLLMHDFVVPVQMANLRERLVAQFAFEIFDILMVSRLHVSLEQIRMLEALLARLAAVFLARSFLHSDLVLLEHVRVRHIHLTVILVVVIVHVVDAVRVFLVHIRVLVSFCEGIGLLEATVIEKLGLFGLIEVVIWHVARITVIIGSIT